MIFAFSLRRSRRLRKAELQQSKGLGWVGVMVAGPGLEPGTYGL